MVGLPCPATQVTSSSGRYGRRIGGSSALARSGGTSRARSRQPTAMAMTSSAPWWSWAWPALAWTVLVLEQFVGVPTAVAALAFATLITTVFAAVYHAEVVAHRVGEPFGTLVLAVAVTVIEVALILSIMIAAPERESSLPRDTVFAAVMIVCNGIVGLCLLVGGARYREQGFQVAGASAALAVLAALTVLTLIMPNQTTSEPGPVFNTAQLAFAGVVSLALYGAFVFVQTMRHRSDFLPALSDVEDKPEALPSNRTTLLRDR